jgi:hypothetical protein
VRTCSLRPGFRTANLDQHDRFPTLRGKLGDADELLHVLESFDEPGNDPCAFVVEQIAREIGEIEIALVAGRNDVTQADAGVNGTLQERPECGCAALTDEPDVTCQTAECARGRRDPDVFAHIGEA